MTTPTTKCAYSACTKPPVPAVEPFCSLACYKANEQAEKKAARRKKLTPKPTVADVVPETKHFEQIPLQTSEERFALWCKIEDVLRANYHKPEINSAKALFATVASHVLESCVPCWTMAIAPPGSMKTALLKSLDGLPRVHFVDEVTENTFLSGKIDDPNKVRKEPASYLHRIGGDGILICADFSTFLSMDPKRFAAVLGQMRRIYDGQLRKEVGSDENPREREWKGRITLLAGCTGAIDSQYKVFQSLGDRFVRVRWDRIGGAEAGMVAIDQEDSIDDEELRVAVHAFLSPILSWPKIKRPEIPQDLKWRIANLSELVCQARSYVPRDGDKYDEIVAAADTESNTRIAQELSVLARAWAILMGRDVVEEDDFLLVKRAAWDTIPPNRQRVLCAVIEGKEPEDVPEIPTRTANRVAEEFCTIGLMVRERIADDDKGKPDFAYSLSSRGRKLIEAIKGDMPDGIAPQSKAEKPASPFAAFMKPAAKPAPKSAVPGTPFPPKSVAPAAAPAADVPVPAVTPRPANGGWTRDSRD